MTEIDDDRPPCNVDNQDEVCYCTRREGCPFADDGDDEFGPDDQGEGYPWPTGVVTEHAFAERGLL